MMNHEPPLIGSLCWARPNIQPNNSNQGHFVVVVYADHDNALLTTLTSDSFAKGKFMDKTCLLELPANVLRHRNQNRNVYVRYDQVRCFDPSYPYTIRIVGALPRHDAARVLRGLFVSAETLPELLQKVTDTELIREWQISDLISGPFPEAAD